MTTAQSGASRSPQLSARIIAASREPKEWPLLGLDLHRSSDVADYRLVEPGLLVPRDLIRAAFLRAGTDCVVSLDVISDEQGAALVGGLHVEDTERFMERGELLHAVEVGRQPRHVWPPLRPTLNLSERQLRGMPLHRMAEFVLAYESLIDQAPDYLLVSAPRAEQRAAVLAGRPVLHEPPEAALTDADGITWWRLKAVGTQKAAAEAVRGARLRSRPPLEEVAAVYRSRPGAGRQAVMDRWGVSDATAKRWASAAEEDGQLPERASEKKRRTSR